MKKTKNMFKNMNKLQEKVSFLHFFLWLLKVLLDLSLHVFHHFQPVYIFIFRLTHSGLRLPHLNCSLLQRLIYSFSPLGLINESDWNNSVSSYVKVSLIIYLASQCPLKCHTSFVSSYCTWMYIQTHKIDSKSPNTAER